MYYFSFEFECRKTASPLSFWRAGLLCMKNSYCTQSPRPARRRERESRGRSPLVPAAEARESRGQSPLVPAAEAQESRGQSPLVPAAEAQESRGQSPLVPAAEANYSRNSTTVTPISPSPYTPLRTVLQRLFRFKWFWIAARSVPVPFPWIMRTDGCPLKIAPERN